MGIIGYGRIAGRFIHESKYVSGLEIISVYGRNAAKSHAFATQYELSKSYTDYMDFLHSVNAVYIAIPHHLHYKFAKAALLEGKHVLCEKPLGLTHKEVKELFCIAKEHNCVLLEGIKTAFAPAFKQLIGVAKSGLIGSIKAVDASFTKLISDISSREYDLNQAGGALTELGSYPLLVIEKLLGKDPREIRFITSRSPKTKVDILTHVELLYSHAIGTATVAIGAKQEGDLCITGTNGYLYVPAPWWKTEQFEARFENPCHNKKYFIKFEGDGLRYELATFLHMIHDKESETHLMSMEDSLFIAGIIQSFQKNLHVYEIS